MNARALKTEEYFIEDEPYMYGDAAYTVIDEVKQLPIKVSEIYRRLTT